VNQITEDTIKALLALIN